MIDFKLIPGRKIKKTGKIKKEEKPIISIITPFYNGGKTLEETANSVFSQTYPFFEWIIVDDGSQDTESLKKLSELEKKDKRIKVFHKENGGPSVARDFGIDKSSISSKYIFFLDCDDMMENNMLECLYWTLETHPNASFAYTAMTNFGDREFVWERYLTTNIEKEENVICISSMIKKEALIEVGKFGIKEKAMYEDWNLWLKLLAAKKTPVRINAPLFWYRVSETGEFSRAKENHQKAMKYIKEAGNKVKDEVEIIQFPHAGEEFSKNPVDLEKLTLPFYEKEDKKTILFIFPWLTIGGADIFNLELIERLNKEKYNIITITTIPKDNQLRQKFYEASNEVYDLSTFLERKDYLRFIEYIIESRNVNIVFVSNSTYGYALLPYIKSKFKDVSIIDYIHSVDLEDPRGGFGRYTSDFSSCIDKTYACNNFTTNQLKKDFNKEDVETIYIGTDHEKFDPTLTNKKELKEKYNIPKDKYIITFIARLSQEKRPQIFIEIAKRLLEIRKDVHFIIAGGGPLEKNVEELIKKYKINEYISLLGWIDNSKSIEVYGISDLTINCSSLEGLALTSYESLSMGVPIISTSVGGQTELIDNKVGRIVEYNEIKTKEEQEREINEYVRNTEEAIENIEELKKNCREKITKGFTLNNMKDKFERIFDNLTPDSAPLDERMAFSIYLEYIDSLYKEYDWFCKEYNSKYGIIEEINTNKNSLKYRIKKKGIKITNKYGIKPEAKIIADFLRCFITIIRDFKYLLSHIYYLIKYFFKSIISTFKIISKIIKKFIYKYRKS